MIGHFLLLFLSNHMQSLIPWKTKGKLCCNGLNYCGQLFWQHIIISTKHKKLKAFFASSGNVNLVQRHDSIPFQGQRSSFLCRKKKQVNKIWHHRNATTFTCGYSSSDSSYNHHSLSRIISTLSLHNCIESPHVKHTRHIHNDSYYYHYTL